MTVVTNKNVPTLDRKEWQMMTPAPVATAAGTFVVEGGSSLPELAMYVVSNTAQYLYCHCEDAWVQIPSGALAGTFGAGACGTYSPWSITYTANGGTTSTVTVAAATHNITQTAIGSTIEFLSAGAATGQRRTVTGVDNRGGAGTITISLDHPVAATIANGNTFRMTSGRFFVLGAGTLAAGSFKTFDVATMTWQASLSITGLPASWGTDGKLVCTARNPASYDHGTATSGSTTTITDTASVWEVNKWVGYYCAIIDGTGEAQVVKIKSNTADTLTFATPVAVAPASGSVFAIRANPASSIGVATAGAASSLTCASKTWTVNQWTNWQVRILSGTGQGQIRNIASNTATVLTTSAAWTTNPDTTSVFQVEPNEDYIYALGNNAVTMYRYSISGNTWTTISPGVARGGAPGAGMMADFVDITGEPLWSNENDIQDGRYIYSFRGGGTSTLDRYDISTNAWAVVTYPGATETFTTGSSGFQQNRFFFLLKDATQRFFKYDIPGNVMLPFNTDLYPSGAAVLGQKIWVKQLDAPNTVWWVYSLVNTSTVLRRIGII